MSTPPDPPLRILHASKPGSQAQANALASLGIVRLITMLASSHNFLLWPWHVPSPNQSPLLPPPLGVWLHWHTTHIQFQDLTPHKGIKHMAKSLTGLHVLQEMPNLNQKPRWHARNPLIPWLKKQLFAHS